MYNLKEIESEKYISLETYKKNNQPVRTPVWFVIKNDLIYVVTRDQTGKAKRLRNNQQVKIATCNLKGKVSGEWVSGTAKILSEEETKEVVKWRDKIHTRLIVRIKCKLEKEIRLVRQKFQKLLIYLYNHKNHLPF